MNDPVFIAGALALNVALSEWLERNTPLRHLGAAMLVIIVTAVEANLGWIPPYGPNVPIYGGVFSYVAPIGIFWLLLGVDLRRVWRAGPALIALFLIGSLGTVLGVIAGLYVVDGREAFGDDYAALGGMFVGTYTGGSVNFNAVALHYRVMENGVLYAGANAVDAAMTTVWMAATLLLPRLVGRFWPSRRASAASPTESTGDVTDAESIRPIDLGLCVGLGALAVWGSEALAGWVQERFGTAIPSLILLTTIALVLAQLGPIQRLRGARVLGYWSVLVFLAVIGALCDLEAVRGLGSLALSLTLFVTVIYAVHGSITFGAAALMRLDPEAAAVASQANVGGGTSALALAKSLGRPDLVVPAILIGALGSAIGTYLGFWVAGFLGS